MKKIYFVRHGESEGNIGPIRQSPESPLTEQGKQQAEILAKRLSNLSFNLLVSSPYQRTKETAEVISRETNKTIIYNDLFIERKRPSEQLNSLKDSELNKKSEKEYDESFANGEKYKDGESFKEITQRAHEALDYLEKQKEDEIVVVTHGMFLRVIFAVILLKDSITPKSCFELMMSPLTMSNTGITVIEINPKNNKWRIKTWNDVAHFAEY